MTSSLRNHPSNSPPGTAPKSGLTISKVVAGAGAAVTTAVVGSSFGADGTVVGAAVGSVVSAVAAAAYERSLDRTRQLVVARVRPVGVRDGDATQVFEAEVTQVIPTQRLESGGRPTGPTQRQGMGAPSTGPTRRLGSGAHSTESVAPVPPPVRRMRLPLLAGATVVVFLVGLLIVTGIELFTGGPVLSSHSERSTSVGTLLGSGSQPSTTEAAPTTAAAESETSELVVLGLAEQAQGCRGVRPRRRRGFGHPVGDRRPPRAQRGSGDAERAARTSSAAGRLAGPARP